MARPITTLLVLASVSAVACGASEPQPSSPSPMAATSASPVASAAPTAAGHSIDLGAMDTTVKPGDDFFLYANGTWDKTAEIPADRTGTGVGVRLTEQVEKHTSEILEEAAKSPTPETKKIGDFYASYMDEAGIEARGLKPLQHTLDRIAHIHDTRGLAAELGSQLRADVDPLNNTNLHTDHVLGLWVEQDLNEPARTAPYLLQGGLGMPDRSYYLDDNPRMATFRTKYVAHIATMLRLAGIKDPDGKAARIMAFEKKLAETHATRLDTKNMAKVNNVWPSAEFATRAPGMDWRAFFHAAGLDTQPAFIVWQPSSPAGLGKLVHAEPLAVWKEYLTLRAIEHAADVLPKAISDESFAFYATELLGVPTRPARWKRGLRAANAVMGEAVGKAYVAKYFPPEAKQAAQKMVDDIVAAFGRRIEGLAWMSPATKAKAKEKLSTLKVGVGYPDAWRDDSSLAIARDDAFGNVEREETFWYRNRIAKLGGPVDRAEWVMVPQIVNAVNLPIRNALNFPAGILAPPYFDAKSTAAANYGAIGAVIGHEISHSFDDEGSRFDAHGRYVSWWTPEDFAHFEASGAALAAQFSQYKPFADVNVDGKLTLSENIADLAGLAASFDAWKTSLAGQPAPTQDGLTGEQQFFLAFAQSWQGKRREAAQRSALKTDGHSPPHYRALTVRNLGPWYEAFGAKPGDGLFLDPQSRVAVW